MTISISEKLLVAVRGEPVWMFYEDNERGTVYVFYDKDGYAKYVGKSNI